jgi:hypothetical protein
LSAKPAQSLAGRWLRQACSQRLPASDFASTRLRQQRRLIVLTLHFPQVGLFDVVEILLAGLLQPLAHFFIGQDLMLQHAELRQRFAAGGAAARGIMANISQPAMAERCEKRDRR